MSQPCGGVFSILFVFSAIFLLPVSLAHPMSNVRHVSRKFSPDFSPYYYGWSKTGRNKATKKVHGPSTRSEEYNADLSWRVQKVERFKTSCGKITCEDVKDYPTEKIRRAFSETYKTVIPAPGAEFDGLENRFGWPYQVRAAKESDNSVELQPKIVDIMAKMIPPQFETNVEPRIHAHHSRVSGSHSASGKSGKYPHFKHPIPNPRDPDCSERVGVIYPEEAINEYDEIVTVVNIDLHQLDALECKAAKYCNDGLTPENHVNLCITKVEMRIWETFINKTGEIKKQKIHVPNGCLCRLVQIGSPSYLASQEN